VRRDAPNARRILFALAAEKPALDDIGKPRHLLGLALHRVVNGQHALIGIDGKVRDMRQSHVLTSAAALFRQPRLRMIDDGVSHRERRSAKEVRFIRKTARLTQAKVGLVNQCRRLQGMPRPESSPRPMRDAPQLLVEGR